MVPYPPPLVEVIPEIRVHPDEPSSAPDLATPPDPTVPGREEDTRNICRSLIQAEPTISFRSVQRAAEGLGLHLSRHLFHAVQREIAAVPGGDDPKEKAPSEEAAGGGELAPSGFIEGKRSNRAPIEFMVSYLRSHPDATFEVVKAAAYAEGHPVFGGTFGRARKLAGLPRRLSKTPSGPRRTGAKAGKPNPRMDFAVEFVKAHPDATFLTLKPAATAAGFEVAPIHLGIARRILGISRFRFPAAAGMTLPPVVSAEVATVDARIVGDFMDLVQRIERERGELRAALVNILEIARRCLERMA